MSQSQVKNTGALFIELNKFIVKVGKASQIAQGQIGMSKYQREALAIAKNDELRFIFPKIIPNPLSQIDLSVDIVYKDDEYPVDQKGAAIVKEKDIQQAFLGLF